VKQLNDKPPDFNKIEYLNRARAGALIFSWVLIAGG
jgi:hypothetical protein